MNTIKEMPSKETYPVCQPIFKEGKTTESRIFGGDNPEATHH